MDVRFFFPVKHAAPDISGNFTLVGAPYYLHLADTLPVFLSSFFLVACVALDREECEIQHELKVQLRDPEGNLLIEIANIKPEPHAIEEDKDWFLINLHFHLQGLLTQKLGLFMFHLYYDGVEIKTAPFRILLKPEAAASLAAEKIAQDQTQQAAAEGE